jgi:hypothetical protein
LAKTVDANHLAVRPAVEAWDEFGKLMKTGRKISLITGISGITLVGWITGAGEAVWEWLKTRM